MSLDQSITTWIVRLKGGDEDAARAVWDCFFDRLCALARSKLGQQGRRAADEEDVALSALHALCQGARANRFRQLESAEDLWQVLAMITCRKASNVLRGQRSRREVGESAVGSLQGDDAPPSLDQVISGDPDYQFVTALSATSAELLAQLEPKLQAVALMRLEGYTNEEIAQRQQRSVKTIERYLKMIRLCWAA
jgi:DNA-directed RNA polymerase specialized sigma24 family protein